MSDLTDRLRSGAFDLTGSIRDEAADEIDRLREALTKIDAIRNDIIGRQKIGWSSHVYPLVAALDEAGYPGLEYEAARAALKGEACSD